MENSKRLLAGLSAMVMLATTTGSLVFAEDTTSETGEVLVSSDFESDLGGFTPRMKEGQSVEVSVVNDGNAHNGDGYLLCTNREMSWHGAQFLTDGILEGGKKYLVNAWVKTPWYATVTLSMQYTDSAGSVHYENFENVVSQGDWAEFSNVKVQIPADCTGVYLYFECSDAKVNIAVDDFTITSTPEYKIQEDIPSLKDVYSPYFKFGGALMASELGSQSTKDLVLKHYDSITFGNELKPDSVLVQSKCQELAQAGNEGDVAVSIDNARSLLNFCQENNIPVRGHVLVWHSQTPDWFFKEGYSNDGDWVSKEVMLQRMENYIKNLMELLATEYPDVDFYAWDVVNEIWLDDGNPRQAGEQGANGSNNSAWVKIFGDNSFVDYAFEYARKYAPEGCKLYYNDFNEYMPQKTQAIVDMVTRIKEAGNIDGIGMQSHLDVSFPSISTYEKALKAFCETGLDVQITELDVTVDVQNNYGGDTEKALEAQAKYYSDIMDLAVKYSDSISAVVVWGTTDDQSWRSKKVPVLFNEDYTAKPCFYSIVDGLDDNPTTETTTAVTDDTTSDTTSETTEDTTTTEPSDTTTTAEPTDTTTGTETSESVTTVDTDDTTTTSEVTDDTTTSEVTDDTTTSEVTDDTTTSEVTDDTTTSTEPTVDTLLGDINLDGKVTTADLLVLKKHLLGVEGSQIESGTKAYTNADVNQDGKVSTADLLSVKKYLLGIITKF